MFILELLKNGVTGSHVSNNCRVFALNYSTSGDKLTSQLPSYKACVQI